MTQEEKAKAYDEALERARKYMAEGYDVLMPEIFPELREGEDERIRKWLYDYISNCPNDNFAFYGGVGKDAVLNYLEKQKECKPVEWEWPNLSNCIRNCKKCHGKCFYRKEPYEEQKPAEKPSMLELLREHLVNTPKEQLDAEFEELKEFTIPKPAEWSEEDESCWNLIWDILDGPFTASKESFKKAAAWFLKNCPKGTKSLRPSWKPSKEEMEALDVACSGKLWYGDIYLEGLKRIREQLKKL